MLDSIKPDFLDWVAACNRYLKDQLSVITKVLPAGSQVAMVDEPVHRNIGDHLIHFGITQFLSDHNIQTVVRANIYSYHRSWFAKYLNPDTIIVCHGGGHFGDLYPAHQRLREEVTRDFPSNRIVILPQSIYFKDPDEAHRAAAALRKHPDFHLFVRDRDSLRKAEALQFPNLYLAPDMAHALSPYSPLSGHARKGANSTLCLMRRDKEQESKVEIESCNKQVDWADLIKTSDTLLLGLLSAAFRICRRLGPVPGGHQLLDRERSKLVRRAERLFADHDQVITSRLHGMIFSILLGKPVAALPSLTGKTDAYIASWLTTRDCMRMLNTPSDQKRASI
jgi:pyruvyl transferase EpsO